MSKLPWHGPLFPVKGHLAERYALALHHLRGLDCPLQEFLIDRMGWSPQLAAKLGEDYLGGEALRYAIILSPDQATATPLRRRFSYETGLIEKVYLDARQALLSLVEQEPVIVELDNGLTFCRTAMDVLGITRVLAQIDTPRETLAKSRRLLELADGLAQKVHLLDDGYIDQMLVLAREVGDPRRRPTVPPLQMQVSSLWVELSGVLYVLRSGGKTGRTLVIATRPDEELKHLPLTALELGDPAVVDLLHQEGFLRYGNEASLLRKRLSELELEALLSTGEATPASDSAARRRQLNANRAAQAALPRLYWELDAEQKRLAAGAAFEPQRLSIEARWALSTPARDNDIVGNLVARFVRYDYRLLAHHHRRIIQAEWYRYTESKRRYLESAFPYMTQGFVRASESSTTTGSQQATGPAVPS